MKMDEKRIRKYASLMKELDLTALEITEDNCVVRLERAAQNPAREIVTVPESCAPRASESDAGALAGRDYISVFSPMVGVFYASPAENADPYVKVGDTVKAGDTLCIVEAMKLMNEILAEVDGTVTEICVKNGQVVDYGSELFRIRR